MMRKWTCWFSGSPKAMFALEFCGEWDEVTDLATKVAKLLGVEFTYDMEEHE